MILTVIVCVAVAYLVYRVINKKAPEKPVEAPKVETPAVTPPEEPRQ